jgi:calcineurin-like phosphoesterase
MASKANLIIDQGSTFVADLNLTDEEGDVLSLIGYEVNSQIRKWYTSSNTAATFTTAVNTDIGVITLSLSSNQTSSLEAGRYVYDVELNDGVEVSRIVEGIITVTPQVTR